MIDYDTDQFDRDEESLSHLEEEGTSLPQRRESRSGGGDPGGKRDKGSRSRDLPDPVYRIRALHSNETFLASYKADPASKPHFRSMAMLEEALQGPVHNHEETSQVQDLPEASVILGQSGGEGGDEAVADEAVADDAAVDAAAADGAVEGEAAIVDDSPAAPGPAGFGDGAETGRGEPGAADAADADVAAGSPPPVPAHEPATVPPQAPAPAAASPAEPSPFRIPDRSIVTAPTRYGRDLCEVQGPVLDTSGVNPDEIIQIERPASLDDLRKLKANEEKEAAAYELCRQKIWSRNLPMKLVSAHYLLDEPKVIFYFSAESRVDFRELVKDLVTVFKMRIELRQIGVRDEARVTGGCGVCGRVLCCHGVSDKLSPVSIKMAKDQNLSLNSIKISGPCGRLLCCLSYEYQFYRDARRELPGEGARITHDGTQFRVVEVNALKGTVKMSGEDGRLLDLKADAFRFSEGRWNVKE